MRLLRHTILGVLLVHVFLFANDTRISGLFFGDYYYVNQHHQQNLVGKNGFWIRRIYLTLDRNLSTAFAVRLRLEMNHPGFTAGGPGAGSAVPFVKDAYLKYSSGSTAVLLGISPSPTFARIEQLWGYRAVEKTPVDLQKMGSSRDFGLAIRGRFASDSPLGYHIMIGNGAGAKSDANSGKKVMVSVGYYPQQGIWLEGYGDYEDRGAERRFTYQGFAGYAGTGFRLGLQYVAQQRKVGSSTTILALASAFGVWRMQPQTSVLLRIDRLLNPNPAGNTITYLPIATTTTATLFIAGIDWQPIEDVHFIPNVESLVYDTPDTGPKPENDVLPRLTFFITF